MKKKYLTKKKSTVYLFESFNLGVEAGIRGRPLNGLKISLPNELIGIIK